MGRAPRMLAVISALVTLLVLGGSATAVAAWKATASVAATASSATVATTLTPAGSLGTTYAYGGASSAVVSGSLTIKNTGTAPLAYTLSNQLTGDATLAGRTSLFLWTGTCGTTVPAGAVTTTLADAAPALPAAARTLAAGASATVCVATRISDGTAATLQGASVTFTLSVTGGVGSQWRTTAPGTPVTQSVFRVAVPDALACRDALFYTTVQLSWRAPANRPTGATMTYRVLDAQTGREIASFADNSSAPSVQLRPADFADGRYTLVVEARESTYGTTSVTSTGMAVDRQTGPLGVRYLHCG